MAAGDLSRALERANERKDAMGMGGQDEPAQVFTVAEQARLFVGFDIPLGEFDHYAQFAEDIAEALGAEGFPAGQIGATLWIDGLLMGLLLMEARP